MIIEKKVNLWMPITKNPQTGKYHAVLSDDSLDRDEERMGKELIDSWSSKGSLPALANHENAMEKWVGGWENIKSIQKGNNNALIADPWFFSKEANPLAHQIKKQIDEAIEKNLNPGISVGAIMKGTRTEKVNGKQIRVFTKGELVEATWVPIQSNRNANYGHIAKKFNLNFKEDKMTDIITQKDIDSAVEKKVEELSKVSKQLDEVKKQVEDLTKSVEEAEGKVEEAEKVKEEAKAETEKANKELKEVKEKALEKQKFSDQGATDDKVLTVEDVDKALADGKMPIGRF